MADASTGKNLSGVSDEVLIGGLASSSSWEAWTELLKRYSPLILKIVRQFDDQEAHQNDCYLHVTGNLAERDFKRLRSYDSGRGASVRTWLSAVVFNICVDWHRKEFGRARLLPAISARPAFDQMVYRYRFEQGLGTRDCLNLLANEFPDVTREQLARSAARVHRMLTPAQRWRAGVRYRRLNKLDHERHDCRASELESLPAPDPEPVESAERSQQSAALQAALSGLDPRQQVLLKLRYTHGLSLKQIARLQGFNDPADAWRRVQKALEALSEILQGNPLIESQKK